MNDFFWAFLNKNEALHWKGFCNRDRNEAIYEIERIVSQYGFITDHHMFSDMELSLKIEIAEHNVQKLYTGLKSYLTMDDVGNLASESPKERSILLNITFVKSSGNLRIEVPAVPG